MRLLASLMMVAALAACGVDGEPITPQATANVTLSSSGAHVGGGVSLGRGPFQLRLGF